jgi:hypothetical protein
MTIPDIGPLPVMIIALVSMVAKFYWATKNHSWITFADGLARLAMALFYLLAYIATLQGSFAAEQDAWRALARLGIAALFFIEALPWAISLFQKDHKR